MRPITVELLKRFCILSHTCICIGDSDWLWYYFHYLLPVCADLRCLPNLPSFLFANRGKIINVL